MSISIIYSSRLLRADDQWGGNIGKHGDGTIRDGTRADLFSIKLRGAEGALLGSLWESSR